MLERLMGGGGRTRDQRQNFAGVATVITNIETVFHRHRSRFISNKPRVAGMCSNTNYKKGPNSVWELTVQSSEKTDVSQMLRGEQLDPNGFP